MDGIATLTIATSRIAMHAPASTTASTSHRRVTAGERTADSPPRISQMYGMAAQQRGTENRRMNAPPVITDEFMHEMMTRTKTYTVVLLEKAPGYYQPGADAAIWEHGRRQFGLRADGVLSIVCPVADNTELAGINVFDASAEEAAWLMDGDPAVQAGVLNYEVHPVRSFPGDRLPG
jgi:hypothetical protein